LEKVIYYKVQNSPAIDCYITPMFGGEPNGAPKKLS